MRTVRDVSAPWHRSPTGQAAALALTIAAFTWTWLGIGVATGAASVPDGAPHTMIPLPARVAFWLIPAAGVVAVLITRRHAALVTSTLILAPMVRIVSYLWAWIAYLAGDTGHPTGWYPAVMHLPLLALVVLIALLTRAARAEGVTR